MNIDPTTITQVLLTDGWHGVKAGTFKLETIEFGYTENDGRWHGTHGPGNTGMAPVGFTFEESDDQRISGSMRTIVAIKQAPTPTQLPA